MTPPPTTAVVLAAGSSRRLGRPKQTLAFRGYTSGGDILRIKAVAWLEHRRVLQCLRRRDGAGARRLIVRHIRKGCREALEAYELRRNGDARPGQADILRRLIGEMEKRWQ